MGWTWKYCLGAGLALASTAAFAFQEERQTPVAPDAPAAIPAPLSSVDPAVSSPGGTEVSIPGLGKLGVLPKMNFGLELLYGAAESSKVEEPQPEADGLTIRGSIKHKF